MPTTTKNPNIEKDLLKAFDTCDLLAAHHLATSDITYAGLSFDPVVAFLEKTNKKEHMENIAQVFLTDEKSQKALYHHHNMFAHRLKMITGLFERGWPGPKTPEETERFLKSLVREYDYAGMGNVAPPSDKESAAMLDLLRTYVRSIKRDNLDAIWTKDVGFAALAAFSYNEREDVFDLLCQSGVFDQALRDHPEKTREAFLTENTSWRDNPLYIYNGLSRNIIIARVCEIGIITPEICERYNVNLFHFRNDKGQATRTLMEAGMKLPVIWFEDQQFTDGAALARAGFFSIEQVRVWCAYDPEGVARSVLLEGDVIEDSPLRPIEKEIPLGLFVRVENGVFRAYREDKGAETELRDLLREARAITQKKALHDGLRHENAPASPRKM